MAEQIKRKLVAIELKQGFLNIPASGIELMPESSGEIAISMSSGYKKLKYNAKYKRLFGLTGWYKHEKAKVGDEIVIEKTGDTYALYFKKIKTEPVKEAEELINISGLSSQAKGDIVEDRIKELVVLQGQGLLSVYKPVTDTHGIDLIVTKTGMFQPIFLQVKSRYNVEEQGFFLMDVGKKTFIPHHSYFVLGAYFNPQKLEIHDYLLFIPSEQVAKIGVPVNKNADVRYRVMNSLSPESKGKWSQYIIRKTELANKLIEKFEEMSKYVR